MEYEQAVSERKKLIAKLRGMLKHKPEGETTTALKAYAAGFNDAVNAMLKEIEGR